MSYPKISNLKTRLNLTLEKDFKNDLMLLAKDDSRSINSLIISILKKELDKEEWQEKLRRLKM